MIELLWTLIRIPIGYATSHFINDYRNIIYNTSIPKSFTYGTITMVTLFSYIRDYTENEIVKNISNNTIEYKC
jgi:hypothetical protein